MLKNDKDGLTEEVSDLKKELDKAKKRLTNLRMTKRTKVKKLKTCRKKSKKQKLRSKLSKRKEKKATSFSAVLRKISRRK